MRDILSYSSVWSDPQSAVLRSTGSIIFRGIHVNGNTWPSDPAHSTLRVLLPNAHFRGIRAIIIGQDFDTGELKRGIGGHLYLPENSEEPVLMGPFGLSIHDIRKTEFWYAEEMYRTDLRQECPKDSGEPYKNYDEYPKVSLIPLGPIIVKQDYKHLTFSGAFRIPEISLPRDPYMICDKKNPAPPAAVSIDEIRINIDSDVEYIWAGKNGKEYRW